MKIEPMPDYLANSAIGSSQLKQILSSPKDYKYSLENSSKETASQSKGTLWHQFILERDLYFSENIVQPEDWGSLTKNPGRRKWVEFKKSAEELGKNAVKYGDAAELMLLDAEINSHEVFRGILKKSKPEISFYAELDGIKIKSREDLWCEETGEVWDIKTTSKDLDEDTLARVIFDNGYHFSAAHHMKTMELAGYPVTSWGWVFVSTSTPCPHIVLKRASRELIEYGQTDWYYAFCMLKDCLQSDSWPGYDEEILEIGLPSWVERKYY